MESLGSVRRLIAKSGYIYSPRIRTFLEAIATETIHSDCSIVAFDTL